MRVRTVPLLVLAVALLLAGCGANLNQTKLNQTKLNQTHSHPRTTDVALEQSVKNQMATNAQLSGNVRVTVDANRNLVTLSGTVPTNALRSKAVALAQKTAADLNVIDEIEVRPSGDPQPPGNAHKHPAAGAKLKVNPA